MVPRRSSSPRTLMMVVTIVATILLPLVATAESITFVRTATTLQQQAPAMKKVHLALDDDGNVSLRFRRVSLTFIYEAGTPPQEGRQQSANTATRQDVACLGGLSVKLGMSF